MSSLSTTNAAPTEGYGRTAVRFHWASALIIILMWPAAKFLMDEDNSLALGIHMWLGMIVFVLTVLRVVHHLRTPQPKAPPMPTWERLLFVANHYLLYLALLAASGSGIGAMLASGQFPIPRRGLDREAIGDTTAGEFHETPANLLMLLFLMHIAGVIYYQLMHGRTLRRMGVPVSK